MLKENNFTPKLKNKSDSEVENFIKNKHQYRKEAVQAAIWELELRGIQIEISSELKKESEIAHRDIVENKKQIFNLPVKLATLETRLIHIFVDTLIISLISSPFIDFSNIHKSQIINITLSLVYYSLFEYFLQQTPSKFITKSIVVTREGKRPSFKTIIVRTLVRLIPFDAFSFLFSDKTGWHDNWTDTYVIKKSDLQKLKESSDE